MSTLFTFVRHGQIQANVDQRWHGSTDSPLTAIGRTQAQRLAAHLSDTRAEFDAVYARPLQRTRDTAAAVAAALGLPLMLDARLREYGVGELEVGFFERISRDRHHAPAGGESLHDVVSRMCAVVEAVADDHPGQRVLMVGHGAAFGILLGHLLDDDPMAWTKYALANCSISEFRLRPAPALLSLNRTDHLDH